MLILALLAPPASAALAPEDLAARVVDLVVHDDLARLDAAVAQEQDLRERLDELECISVRSAAWEIVLRTEDKLTLRVDLDAVGTTTAASRPEVRFPPTWYAEAERVGGEWRILRLLSDERRTARAMLAAPTAGDAECLFAEAVHPSRVVEQYADVIDDARRPDRMPHALALAGSLGDPRALIGVLRLDATLRVQVRDPEAAATARRALELARRAGTADDVADTTFTLAVTRMLDGDTAAALEQFAAAAGMVEGLDYPIMAMKALHMYAWVARGSGRILDSLRASERLMALARRHRWPEGEIDALFQLASVHFVLGNSELYASYLDDARRVAVHAGHRANLARLNYNRAELLRAGGDAERAVPLVLAVIADAGTLNRSEWPQLYVGYAGVLMDLGRYDEAEAAIAKARSFEAETPATVLLARAELDFRRGRYDGAIDAAREAIGVYRKSIHETEVMTGLASAFGWMGAALRRRGRAEEAIEALRSSLSAHEQFVAAIGSPVDATRVGRLPAYVDLIELLVERNEGKEALRVAERMRARSLRDSLQRGHINLSASMTEAEREREQELTERLAAANRRRWSARPDDRDGELAAARMELERFRGEMRVAHPAFARRHPPQDGEPRLPPGLESLTAVEYVVGETQTIALVVKNGADVVAVPIAVTVTELERRAQELATLMASRSVAYRAASRRMYDLLLAPLEKHLGADGMLCVIPDGPLWSIPFHALVSREGSFLIDRRPVFYASSLALLRAAMERPPTRNPALIAFGNPEAGGTARATVRSAFRDVPLGPLLDAETETLAISRMYGGGSRVYLRDRARETVFKSEAPGYGIIHVAAHAIVDHRAPMYSAIVLAGTGDGVKEDGLLEAREVADLPLDAELAVLSACDTAGGKAAYGEGVIGLGWAFQAAGTPALLVSQWKAESRATAELMIEFHRRLRAGATIADALRRAQLSVRRRYPHPFHWAPFIAVGAAAKPVAAAR